MRITVLVLLVTCGTLFAACDATGRDGQTGGASANGSLADPEAVPDHDYDAATLSGFGRLTEGTDWELATPARNAQGMLEAVHLPTGLTFVLIPAGTFTMGGTPEGETAYDPPTHPEVISQPFLICRTECTQGAWDRVGGEDERKWRGAELPIEVVSWHDATAWCEIAGLRLPTEAEWEYACKAGTTTAFSFGDSDADLGDYAWFGGTQTAIVNDVRIEGTPGNSEYRTHPVAGKRPNPWGLYDVHGNVSEWCEDLQRNAEQRGLRGGNHFAGSYDHPTDGLRSSARSMSRPERRFDWCGFRPAATLPVD